MNCRCSKAPGAARRRKRTLLEAAAPPVSPGPPPQATVAPCQLDAARTTEKITRTACCRRRSDFQIGPRLRARQGDFARCSMPSARSATPPRAERAHASSSAAAAIESCSDQIVKPPDLILVAVALAGGGFADITLPGSRRYHSASARSTTETCQKLLTKQTRWLCPIPRRRQKDQWSWIIAVYEVRRAPAA